MSIRFVTGTDTGVGKTVVSAALCLRARAEGRSVRYFKPVQTGVGTGQGPSGPTERGMQGPSGPTERETEPGDAGFVAAVAGVPADEGMRFAAPLAPAVAAAVEGSKVDTDLLREQALDLARSCDVLVVEGAGGLLVPLSDRVDMAGFAASLGAELVVVTRPGLGTLNHTALTVEAARRRGLDPVLVVCNWPARPGLTETTNLEHLKEMAPVLGLVPHVEGLSVESLNIESPPVLEQVFNPRG